MLRNFLNLLKSFSERIGIFKLFAFISFFGPTPLPARRKSVFVDIDVTEIPPSLSISLIISSRLKASKTPDTTNFFL